ncbi:MAG: pyrroline-5-carboxylate reductase [Actinobacteria bacterium]|nr:pyrroline-5-carboxylate reductase [Actinomycetota bacterium]NBY15360.1 pyrroline-5-carboxylate reductase [Actinomycetota bacterium]
MNIALIGAGVMGETLLSGILRSGIAPEQIFVAEIRADRAVELAQTYGVTCSDARTAVAKADTVLLVVKPQDIPNVLSDIADALSTSALVISLAAGITTKAMEAQLPEGQAVVRVMPNTPALVAQGMSGVSAGSNCSAEQLDQVVQLMNSVGKTVVIPESLQDALTAVSGSGPAYIFYIIESMVAAAVELGIDASMATELVEQTVFGAASLIMQTGDSAKTLRERVSSPNGVTVAAIRTLDQHAVREAFLAAMQAAVNRSIELGQPS